MSVALGAALVLGSVVAGLVGALHDGADGRLVTSHEAIALDYVASVNGDDWPHVRALLAPSFVFHDENGFVQGRAGFLVWSQVLRESYPDLTIEVADVRVADDVVTVHVRVGGNGDGPRRCDSDRHPDDLVQIRVRDRLIVEMWSTYGEFGLGC
jgi:hypothetical protein